MTHRASNFFLIIQALIAESVGSYDTMDLFRHTTELSTHVCLIISEICTVVQKFGVCTLKINKVSYAHKGCIYLFKNSNYNVTVILIQFKRFTYILKCNLFLCWQSWIISSMSWPTLLSFFFRFRLFINVLFAVTCLFDVRLKVWRVMHFGFAPHCWTGATETQRSTSTI